MLASLAYETLAVIAGVLPANQNAFWRDRELLVNAEALKAEDLKILREAGELSSFAITQQYCRFGHLALL